MRMLVFFDLPVVTKTHRRAYTVFRRFLLNDGYDMIQFSVYGRILNGNVELFHRRHQHIRAIALTPQYGRK